MDNLTEKEISDLIDTFRRYFDMLVETSDKAKDNGREYKDILKLVGELEHGIKG